VNHVSVGQAILVILLDQFILLDLIRLEVVDPALNMILQVLIDVPLDYYQVKFLGDSLVYFQLCFLNQVPDNLLLQLGLFV